MRYQIYIPPYNSNYFHPELFEDLEKDIEHFCSRGSILLVGDFNSRTGKYLDVVSNEGNHMIANDQSEFSLAPFREIVLTTRLTIMVSDLLDICRSSDLRILNGRVNGNSLGRPTFHGRNGISVIATQYVREVTGSSPVEVLNFFQASLRNCKNCDHNCEDHSSFDFISAVHI